MTQSAFPYQEILPDGLANLTPQRGMTLRDYFAAKAMQSINSRPDYDDVPADFIAQDAYALADAMMKARKE